MAVFKWILLIAVIGLTLWLLIDTIVLWVKKFKARKKAKEKPQEDNNVIDNNDN